MNFKNPIQIGQPVDLAVSFWQVAMLFLHKLVFSSFQPTQRQAGPKREIKIFRVCISWPDFWAFSLVLSGVIYFCL